MMISGLLYRGPIPSASVPGLGTHPKSSAVTMSHEPHFFLQENRWQRSERVLRDRGQVCHLNMDDASEVAGSLSQVGGPGVKEGCFQVSHGISPMITSMKSTQCLTSS